MQSSLEPANGELAASSPGARERSAAGLAALLATIGAGRGPDMLCSSDASAALQESEDLLRRAGAGDDAVIAGALLHFPAMWNMLNDPVLRTAVATGLRGDPGLLSRADLVRNARRDKAPWRHAGGRLGRPAAVLRAVMGFSVFVPLGPAKITVGEASRGEFSQNEDLPPGIRLREIMLGSGQSVFVSLGSRYRLSDGCWLCLDFVRTWMKPDILFVEALPSGLLDGCPQYVRDWCGAGISLPVSLDDFIAAEAAAARGEIHNIHGRGV